VYDRTTIIRWAYFVRILFIRSITYNPLLEEGAVGSPSIEEASLVRRSEKTTAKVVIKHLTEKQLLLLAPILIFTTTFAFVSFAFSTIHPSHRRLHWWSKHRGGDQHERRLLSKYPRISWEKGGTCGVLGKRYSAPRTSDFWQNFIISMYGIKYERAMKI
jgi:hypothetical protein